MSLKFNLTTFLKMYKCSNINVLSQVLVICYIKNQDLESKFPVFHIRIGSFKYLMVNYCTMRYLSYLVITVMKDK